MPEKKTTKSPRKKYTLSKSTFIKGLQCKKALYLYKNRYFLRDPLSAEQRAKFNRGTNVGIYARELFPGGVDASPKTHFQMAQSVEKTQKLIEENQTSVIYEAAFAYDDVVIALDILYKEDDQWKGIEVKSSKRISETYMWDAALQYYVIKGAGLNLKDLSIAYINTGYTKKGDLEPGKLFLIESVKENAESKKEQVAQLIQELKETVGLKKSPDIPIGKHCNTPYPCEFRGHCWKKVPLKSLHHIDGLEEDQIFDCFNQDCMEAKDLPAELMQNPTIKVQVESIESQQSIIQKETLASYLQEIRQPTAILCTHSFAPALPLFENTSPYTILPWGISLIETSDKRTKNIHTIANYKNLPFAQIGQRLIEETQSYKTILVWDLDKEHLLIDSYQQYLPQLKTEWKSLKSKLTSLQLPFKKQWIVNPLLNYKAGFMNVLHHSKTRTEAYPEKIRIPEEAAALYEKALDALSDTETVNPQELEPLKTYMQASINNQYKIWSWFHTLL